MPAKQQTLMFNIRTLEDEKEKDLFRLEIFEFPLAVAIRLHPSSNGVSAVAEGCPSVRPVLQSNRTSAVQALAARIIRTVLHNRLARGTSAPVFVTKQPNFVVMPITFGSILGEPKWERTGDSWQKIRRERA